MYLLTINREESIATPLLVEEGNDLTGIDVFCHFTVVSKVFSDLKAIRAYTELHFPECTFDYTYTE